MRSTVGGAFEWTFLKFRDKENTELTLVSDLAKTNLVNHQGLQIKKSGCTSHARRRFAKLEGPENDYNEIIMNNFTQLYQYEHLLDIEGRNRSNTQSVRQNCSKPDWEEIKEMCVELSKEKSSSTPLGAAARYVIGNYTELTHYLTDPRLPHTNDLSERLLRPEKVIQAAASFRNTIEGRAALDIVRSLIQTSAASNVNATRYIDWVLRTPEEKISAHPERYTPYAFRQNILENN